MLNMAVIVKITIIMIMSNIVGVENGSAPTLNEEDVTSCEEFSRFARFNPYTVLDGEWMSIYNWGPPMSPMFVRFYVPTKKVSIVRKLPSARNAVLLRRAGEKLNSCSFQMNLTMFDQIAYMKYEMEEHLIKPINWTARNVFMKERNNMTYFLEERTDRGRYKLYELYKDIHEDNVVIPLDVRLKQTGDNLYFALMECKQQIVFIFSRIKDIPKKDKIQDVVARFGYRSRGGRSYLYQGHQWMPVGEADDEQFEQAMRFREFMK